MGGCKRSSIRNHYQKQEIFVLVWNEESNGVKAGSGFDGVAGCGTYEGTMAYTIAYESRVANWRDLSPLWGDFGDFSRIH
ncbi:hypothetical protein CEXT_740581 [Caerostris extrusa]|uniref:Uncharacterized protein n=1 Tax=Caerostris extrusa TaxID=172846 RepID=A0AAV4YCT1_CAEEX|nr:hypothetical protein CEXT_740581 [Caerostris extrusa]